MPNTSLGTPYVSSSDYVSNYPTVSQNLANAIDALPRGLVYAKQNTSLNQTISTTATAITGLSLTFTAVASRAYRISLYLPYGARPSTGRVAVYIVSGATTLSTAYFDGADAMPKDWFLSRVMTFSAGSTTIGASAQVDAGTGNATFIASATAPAQLVVEDMGSAGTIA